MAFQRVSVAGTVLRPLGIVVPGSGTVTITSVPSTKNFAEGKGVYKTPLEFTVSGANASGYIDGTVATVGTARITATAVKTFADGILVMRHLDQESNAMQGIPVGGVSPVQFNETWEIENANQTKVLAE